MDSGEVLWPCTSALDCSLNGKCVGGACSCSAAWTGHRCQTLTLQPVDKSKMGFVPTKDGRNMSSWGGSVQAAGGRWHMWAARMDFHCGIQAWVENSRIVHAVASDPLGPYHEVDTVVPPFAHEPCVARTSEGLFVMVSMQAPQGNASRFNTSSKDPIRPYNYSSASMCHCSNFTEPGACPAPPPSPPNTRPPDLHPFLPILNVATSPEGPWNSTRLVTMGQGDSNLAICEYSNGLSPGSRPTQTVAVIRDHEQWERGWHGAWRPVLPRRALEQHLELAGRLRRVCVERRRRRPLSL